MPRSTRFSDELGKLHVGTAYYDFAEDGGVVGPIELPGEFPADAVILGGAVDVLTTCATAGADAGTIALKIKDANDIVSAIAVSDGGNPWDAGRHDIIPDHTGSTAIKLTADSKVVLTIAGQAVTAGKLAVHLTYVMSPDPIID